MTTAPVLFIVFNRPDTTKRVLTAIGKAKPPRLYIAADGPRPDRPGEAERCEEARRVATNVTWDCDVKTLFREENLGCRRAVSSAIRWFFDTEEMGIILEDDCVPEQSFFPFCSELLERYRNESKVLNINGWSPLAVDGRLKSSYSFSRYPHIWGWASWRRAWDTYQADPTAWRQVSRDGTLKNLLGGDANLARHWEDMFNRVYFDGLDTWDYQWSFSCFLQEGLCIAPKYNMIQNIGFGAEATHTKDENGKHSHDKVVAMTFPLVHPSGVFRDVARDRLLEERSTAMKEALGFLRPLKRMIMRTVSSGRS